MNTIKKRELDLGFFVHIMEKLFRIIFIGPYSNSQRFDRRKLILWKLESWHSSGNQ